MPPHSSTRLHSGAFVPFPKDLVGVRIARRLNRFVVEVQQEQKGDSLLLHMPNSGRMEELLAPGTRGLATLDGGGERKTAGTLLLVHYAGRWVSVDARMPNRLLEQCLITDYLSPFLGYEQWESEVSWGKGRIDFRLTGPERSPFLVETKSCNLVEGGVALFPDAPTERGTRHLIELAEAVGKGYRAAIVWLVQRDDADRLTPHRRADPAFADALRTARTVGVEAYAYRCKVTPIGIEVLGPIPVIDT